ncbi:hypothetical protein MYX77_08380, partial [Acidobacteriia bacterium AH_259_A11_L15]|nr:hypothetical protein [Acidobacteriia bacterium AH_259_A11_L15]
WHQLCSSLDVIEDTELAMAAYSAGEFGESDGARYLATYGLLQALFLQQDAVFHMCEALGIPKRLDEFEKLIEIREIRHVSIGHPTKKDRSKSRQPTSYHFISQPTLRPDGFQLLSLYADGRSEFKDVSIIELIEDQRKHVSEILISVVSELEARETAHKEKFRMEKLASTFPPTLSYSFEKIFEAIEKRELAPLGQWGLTEIKRTLVAFQESLEKRGEPCDFLGHCYEKLEYAVGKLESFFGQTPGINQKDAHIFLCFVQEKVNELRKIAEELDEEYSSQVAHGE